MSEKMKCPRCGKRFKQTNKKQVFCADCLAKERAARKNAPQLVSSPNRYAPAGSPHRAETANPPSGITIVQATPPPEPDVFGARARIAEHTARPAHAHAPEPKTAPPAKAPAAATPPRQPTPPQQPEKKSAQPAKRPTPKQKHTTPPPFELSDEVRATIEQRYLDLAQPVEFDGIRTQIAAELNVPKVVVKQAIRELRVRRQLPSWWELKAYTGSEEDLERIRQRYLPLLPVPPVGVHKQIAAELHLEAPQVYQAIRRLRAELKLPQYNPPEAHASDKTTPQSTNGVAAGSPMRAEPE